MSHSLSQLFERISRFIEPPEYLLPVGVSGNVAVLPANTTLFKATVRFGRLFYLVLGVSIITFLVLIAISAGNGLIIGLSISIPVLGSIVLYILSKAYTKGHERLLQQGAMNEGIALFPNGEIVLRLTGVIQSLDQTIESSYFSRAEVEIRFEPRRCWFKKYIIIHHMSFAGKGLLTAISQIDLVDDVSAIAQTMNEVKSRRGGGFIF
jgi:hypothetical protein